MNVTTKNRLAALRSRFQDQAIDTLLVLSGENRQYLSGFRGEDGQFDESAGALLITGERKLLATDSRYETQARTEAPEFEIYRYEHSLAKSLPEILRTLDVERLGFESVRLSYRQFQKFEQELKDLGLSVSLVPTENLVEELRMIKDTVELQAIQARSWFGLTNFSSR